MNCPHCIIRLTFHDTDHGDRHHPPIAAYYECPRCSRVWDELGPTDDDLRAAGWVVLGFTKSAVMCLVAILLVGCAALQSPEPARLDRVSKAVTVNFVPHDELARQCGPHALGCADGDAVWIHDFAGQYTRFSGEYPVDVQFVTWSDLGRQCGLSLTDTAPCEIGDSTIIYHLTQHIQPDAERTAGAILAHQWGIPDDGFNANQVIGHEVIFHVIGGQWHE